MTLASSDSIFAEFLGQHVKVPYIDGTQYKIARGRLEIIDNGFVRITGNLGTIIINKKNIVKMGLMKNDL